MSEQDQGNETTKNLYQMAREPIFSDQNLDSQANISWEVPGTTDEEPAEQEEVENDSQSTENVEETQDENPEEPDKQDEPVSQEEDDEKEKIKKKNRTSEKKRISILIRQLKQAQSVTHDVLSRNQYLESKLSEKQKESIDQEEKLLISQKEQVKKYLTDSLEEGDPVKITEAHDLLSQYNAELRLVHNRKNEKPEPQVPSYPKIQQSENVYDYSQEVAMEWMERNAWANPDSDDFDKSLHEEADNYSIELSKKYALRGKKNEIGSMQFFEDITNYMHSKHDPEYVREGEENPNKPQPQKVRMQMKNDTSRKVAPVTRQTPLNESSRKSSDIVLTAEQKATAHSMRGHVRDKNGNKIIDNKMLEEEYKRNMR
jgi:hypothetical protein